MPNQGLFQGVKVGDKVMNYIALFFSDCRYYPHFVDIHIPWILPAFCGYNGYYPHFVDIISIYHIKIYLACNVRPIFHIYSSIVSDWCITSFPACN